jgi:hypothetical protein
MPAQYVGPIWNRSVIGNAVKDNAAIAAIAKVTAERNAPMSVENTGEFFITLGRPVADAHPNR